MKHSFHIFTSLTVIWGALVCRPMMAETTGPTAGTSNVMAELNVLESKDAKTYGSLVEGLAKRCQTINELASNQNGALAPENHFSVAALTGEIGESFTANPAVKEVLDKVNARYLEEARAAAKNPSEPSAAQHGAQTSQVTAGSGSADAQKRFCSELTEAQRRLSGDSETQSDKEDPEKEDKPQSEEEKKAEEDKKKEEEKKREEELRKQRLRDAQLDQLLREKEKEEEKEEPSEGGSSAGGGESGGGSGGGESGGGQEPPDDSRHDRDPIESSLLDDILKRDSGNRGLFGDNDKSKNRISERDEEGSDKESSSLDIDSLFGNSEDDRSQSDDFLGDLANQEDSAEKGLSDEEIANQAQAMAQRAPIPTQVPDALPNLSNQAQAQLGQQNNAASAGGGLGNAPVTGGANGGSAGGGNVPDPPELSQGAGSYGGGGGGGFSYNRSVAYGSSSGGGSSSSGSTGGGGVKKASLNVDNNNGLDTRIVLGIARGLVDEKNLPQGVFGILSEAVGNLQTSSGVENSSNPSPSSLAGGQAQVGLFTPETMSLTDEEQKAGTVIIPRDRTHFLCQRLNCQRSTPSGVLPKFSTQTPVRPSGFDTSEFDS